MSIANVATRWVLDQPAVAAVIVGARLGESEHRDDNLRIFAFALDAEDRATPRRGACRAPRRIPGDCGDEYRRPPFLTASGDLSHHLSSLPEVYTAEPVPGRPGRSRVDTGSIWEPCAAIPARCGWATASSSAARPPPTARASVVCPGDAAAQTVYALDKIAASICSAGRQVEDVVRTRIFLRDCRALGGGVACAWPLLRRRPPGEHAGRRPRLVGDYEVEIEAEAIVG